MEEDKEVYVSFKLAQLLKEAGFSWPVRSFYQEPKPGSSLDMIFRESPKEHQASIRHDMPFGKEDWNHKEMKDRIYYSCPTADVARRWFREEKGIAVLVGYDVETDNNYKPVKMVYSATLRSIKMNGVCCIYERRTADTFEDAQEAAILLAIKFISKKEED